MITAELSTRKKKASVHVTCHVCMHWAATLSFSQINLLVTEHLVAIIFQTTLWGHLGFQRTPTASEQTGNQVLAPHTEPLWLTACSLIQLSLLLESNFCFLRFKALRSLFGKFLGFVGFFAVVKKALLVCPLFVITWFGTSAWFLWKQVVLWDRAGFHLKIPLGTKVISTEISQLGPALGCTASMRGSPLSTQLSLQGDSLKLVIFLELAFNLWPVLCDQTVLEWGWLVSDR